MNDFPSTPETVCLQCGDVGFSNAFVYCIKCLGCAVHRYCLNIIPKSLDEFVRWICDDCEAEEQIQQLLHNTTEHNLGYFGSGMKKNDEAVILLAPDEAKRCEQSSSQSHTEATVEHNLIFNELSADTSPRGSVEKRQKGLDFGTQCADMTIEKRGINLSRESEVGKDIRGFSKDHSTISSSMTDCNTSAAPVMDPIWRGSFNIWDNEDDILEEVMAHMSISACHKVYDEACQFKPVIHLEKLPRSHVWPKSFEQSESGAGNIALFFFPSERSEQVYDDLVDEMVEDELALKGIVQNAELLVFPSTKLPLSYWRFQGKYYLWGVFREKQPVASRSPSCRRGSSEGEIAVKMKNFRGESPRSPLSNCSSYGSSTPLTKSLP